MTPGIIITPSSSFMVYLLLIIIYPSSSIDYWYWIRYITKKSLTEYSVRLFY
ncbi:hypothetical protein PMI13_02015, partial [Chryseobacterium populi]